MLFCVFGYGIGKFVFIFMLINWVMFICEDCKVVVIVNIDNQLCMKIWLEIIKWLNLVIMKEWFICIVIVMYSNDLGYDKCWCVDVIFWFEYNIEVFVGLYNECKCIVVVFDEVFNIVDLVWEVVEGVLMDEDIEIIWVVFGNLMCNIG